MKLIARLACWLGVVALSGSAMAGGRPEAARENPFARFRLPEGWQARFWAEPGVAELLERDAKALAAMVPSQAGLRHCRCPACYASEAEDTLAWSPARPDVVTCRKCGVAVPSDKYPAKVPPAPGQPPAIPEEVVEVLPRVVHKYPYHAVEAVQQEYPDERLYLAARRDYEAREFLSKIALYAALRHGEAPDPKCARLAAALILRFAQVYPAYATHLDQPAQTKILQRADLAPPYRRGYQTGKWDWSGCLDVPLNLVVAYAYVRDDPALAEAGRALGDPHPARTIERDLFRASADFVLAQPEEDVEASLYADRGLLAVARLLGDEALLREAARRLDGFAERGFYHDGSWRQGDGPSQRRVLELLDGWIDWLMPGEGPVTMVELARRAGGASLIDPKIAEVQRAAWSPRKGVGDARPSERAPVLLGGAGIARLAVGRGDDALDLELRGLGSFGSDRQGRLSLRLAVGGRPVLGDLDDLPPLPSGWDRASASHNTVVVDGLNQRESIDQAMQPAPGADMLFFAADPDFQVATFEDRRAYPRSTTLYRETVVASAGPKLRYAASVFEVRGGLQHDWIAHAASGSKARWRASPLMVPGPSSLLPTTIPFVPTARAEDGRWFVQAFGHFAELEGGRVDRSGQAVLRGPDAGVRLHLLGDAPSTLLTATSPDPGAPDAGRASLIARRRSLDGETLASTFVTVFEPIGPAFSPMRRVGRVDSPPGTVVLALETAEGTEHLVVNLRPGSHQAVSLSDGSAMRTDGLAVRVRGEGLVLAGGTFADAPAGRLTQPRVSGTIVDAGREVGPGSLGWFDAHAAIEQPDALAGRALLIRHGDGTMRGWTIQRAEKTSTHRCRLFVRERPGFAIDHAKGLARYYQFPGTQVQGPHCFRVALMAR